MRDLLQVLFLVITVIVGSSVPLQSHTSDNTWPFPRDGTRVVYEIEDRDGLPGEAVVVKGARTYLYTVNESAVVWVTETVMANVTWPSWPHSHRIDYYAPIEYSCSSLKYYNNGTNVGCYYPKPSKTDRTSSQLSFTYSYPIDSNSRRCLDQPTRKDIVTVTAIAYHPDGRVSYVNLETVCRGRIFPQCFGGFLHVPVKWKAAVPIGSITGYEAGDSWYTYQSDNSTLLLGQIATVMVFPSAGSDKWTGGNYSWRVFYLFEKSTGIRVAAHQESFVNGILDSYYDERLLDWSLELSTSETVTSSSAIQVSLKSTRSASATYSRSNTARQDTDSDLSILAAAVLAGIAAVSISTFLLIRAHRRKHLIETR